MGADLAGKEVHAGFGSSGKCHDGDDSLPNRGTVTGRGGADRRAQGWRTLSSFTGYSSALSRLQPIQSDGAGLAR